MKKYFLQFVKLSRYATSLVSNNKDEMSMFLTWITRDLKEEFHAAILHDYMDLFRLMVHVQQVENNRKKRGVDDATRPKPYDKAGPSNRGNMNKFGVLEQPRFKKGQQSLGNSIFRRSTTLRGGTTEPNKVNGYEMQHPRKNYAKCGRAHSA